MISILSQFHASWGMKTESPLSQVPRPRPRPRLEGSKTKTETKTPRFKTETETKTCKNGSRDQHPSLENSQVCQQAQPTLTSNSTFKITPTTYRPIWMMPHNDMCVSNGTLRWTSYSIDRHRTAACNRRQHVLEHHQRFCLMSLCSILIQ